MKYQMPEPPYELAHGRYTKEQVQAAFDAGRVAGLEVAAKVCAEMVIQTVGHSAATAMQCEEEIRNLAKETPCA